MKAESAFQRYMRSEGLSSKEIDARFPQYQSIVNRGVPAKAVSHKTSSGDSGWAIWGLFNCVPFFFM